MFILFALVLSTHHVAHAEEKTPPSSSGDFFMCKKMRKSKLADLKADLVDLCNLNKPFSISETDIGVENSYTFCCHKK